MAACLKRGITVDKVSRLESVNRRTSIPTRPHLDVGDERGVVWMVLLKGADVAAGRANRMLRAVC